VNWRDLITDSATGQVSHTKLWANVAYASATGVLITADSSSVIFPEVFFIYLGTVGASATASKFLSLKYGKPSEEEKAT
jgi:hypothetical protein